MLVFISKATARRDYLRIGPETALRTRLSELQAYYEGEGTTGIAQDVDLVKDMKQVLLEFHTAVTLFNRRLNPIRYTLRSRASSHLVRSLIWALGATTVLAADELANLPKVIR